MYGLDPGLSEPNTEGSCELPDYEDNIVDEEMLTDLAEISDHKDPGNTFHSVWRSILDDQKSPTFALNPPRDGTKEIASAIFYTYIWGWYSGFIEMPLYSIQGLLSNPPVCLACDPAEVTRGIQESNETLRQYRFLSSLFADESDLRFESENFGLLTPFEARDKYEDSYDGRFDAYFGRTLGGVLELLPGMHQ